jgi:all-beta uncharacterized protein
VYFFLSVLIVLSVLAMPAPAAAQSVVDATTAEFQPSADHSATASDGTPLVNSYLLQIFATGSSIPSYSIDMGKPTPGADGLIRFAFASRLTVPLVGGTIYEARVSAVGPGGSTSSQTSNTFASSAPCAPALSSVATSVGASATTGSVSVAAGTTCAWTTRANVTWLTVTSGASVTGAGNVNYSVSANTASTSRSGTLTIAGQTFTVNQSGSSPTCTYAINPGSRNAVAAGETISVSVTAGTGCHWTASSPVSWVVVTSGASGSSNGSVNLTVSANPGTSSRTATVAIAGKSFTVTQAGSCGFTVTPSSLSVAAAGSSSTLSIATNTGCSWSASGMPSWITMPSTAQTGPGTLSYVIAPNLGVARSVTLTVAGRQLTVAQSAAVVPTPSNVHIVGGSDQ